MSKIFKIGDKLRVEPPGYYGDIVGHLFTMGCDRVGFIGTNACDIQDNWKIFGNIVGVNYVNNITYDELNAILSLDKNRVTYTDDDYTYFEVKKPQ
jgi:hypothetical protein